MREKPVLALGELLSNAVTQFRAIHPRQPIPDLSPVSKFHAIPTLELAQRITSIAAIGMDSSCSNLLIAGDTAITILRLRCQGPAAACFRYIITCFSLS